MMNHIGVLIKAVPRKFSFNFMDVVDLTLSDSDNETVGQTDRRKLPAWSSAIIPESFGLPQMPVVNTTSRSEQRAANTSRNSDVDEARLVSQSITSTANTNEGLDGEMDEMLGKGENPAFVSTAATSFSGTAIDRRCLPPSLMHGKPIPGSSGLENDPRKSLKKGPHLQYQNGFMDTPHPSNGSAGSKGNVQNVLSGLHSHTNGVHEVADTQASKPSSDGHNYSYNSDYGRPFNDKSFRPEGGKVIQKAPHADSFQGNKDEILIYENVSRRRQLPVTLLNEKHSGPSLPSGYGENTHYHGTVEDKPKETDERLIFRAALEEEKRKMVASAFAEDQTGSFATRLTVEDLRYLFMV